MIKIIFITSIIIIGIIFGTYAWYYVNKMINESDKVIVIKDNTESQDTKK